MIELQDGYYGFRMGNVVSEYTIMDLDGNSFKMKTVFENKDLVLVDFWGTWCTPCKELTPELIKLSHEQKEKINVLSLAFRENSKPVKDYVDADNTEWYHGFIKGAPKSSKEKPKIISELRIVSYPTFIILDSNLKIVFKGDGG